MNASVPDLDGSCLLAVFIEGGSLAGLTEVAKDSIAVTVVIIG